MLTTPRRRRSRAALMSLHDDVDSVVEKAACHHAALAADAFRRAVEERSRDQRCTSAFHAGRVLAELVVAGERERALAAARNDVEHAVWLGSPDSAA